MKKTALLLLLLNIFLSISAQDYKNALGIQLGMPIGISYKHHVGNNGFELQAGAAIISSGFNLKLFYEYYMISNEKRGWFIGLGGGYTKNPNLIYAKDEVYGLNTIIGGELIFPNHPIISSFYWMPGYKLNGNWTGDFFLKQYGVSIKYKFN